MQELIVIIAVVAASLYVGYYLYKHLIGRKDKCEGCAVYKLHRMKMENEVKR